MFFKNRCLVVAMIDDYTTIHSAHRPSDSKASFASVMCTIVCRIFRNIPAIPNDTLDRLHCSSGIDIPTLTEEITRLSSMHFFGRTYSENMPDRIRESFFDPEFVRHRLDAHSYHHSENVRKMRCLDNLYLIDFIQQPLKSKANFATAVDVMLDSTLKEYLKKYTVIMPGD